ncbi:sensor histidine kinase [Cohnella rhizosphaerae]
MPVLTPDGQIFGSLCAFDDRFYRFEERDVELLLSLSRFFTDVLALDETVAQLQTAQEQAMRALEEKDNLLAVLSHEIRTPMNGVLGMAYLLRSTALTEEQLNYVSVIEGCGEGLMEMLNQILEHAKIAAGKMCVASEPFNLEECAEQVIQMHAFEAGKKNIGLRLSIDDKLLGNYEGDGLKIRQVLINLVSNAVKFTERGGNLAEDRTGGPARRGRRGMDLLQRMRHGDGHRAGTSGSAFPLLFPGPRQIDQMQLRRHRTRSVDLPPIRRADGRQHRSDENGTRRFLLYADRSASFAAEQTRLQRGLGAQVDRSRSCAPGRLPLEGDQSRYPHLMPVLKPAP